MGKKLEAAFAESEEIERDPDRIARADTVTSRGAGRNRVLQIRLSDDEYDALLAIAGDEPASAVARNHLLDLINGTAPDENIGHQELLRRLASILDHVADELPNAVA